MKLNEETILNYLDGQLSSEDEQRFRQAIEEDRELQRLYVHHRDIHQSLEKENLASPSPAFSDRVMATVYRLHATRSRFFNRSRLFVISLISIILVTTLYYFSIQFYPTLGTPLASDVTLREVTINLDPAKNFLNSAILFKVVFYVNGVVCLFLLDRAVLKPYFARRRERYSM